MSGLRIVFAGTPDFSAQLLNSLLEDGRHQVVAVYCQPDRPRGRGKKLAPPPVKEVALDHDLPVHQPLSLKAADEQSTLAAYQADVMVVVAYGLLLPRAILDTPRLGCINVHASLLPRWRGAAPIERAIEAGDSSTGITIMQMDEGLDTGAMLHRVSIPISPSDTGDSLRSKLAEISAPALLKCLMDASQGRLQAEIQDDSLACYAKKLSKQEAMLDWRCDANQLERRIRAFTSSNPCFTLLGDERLRIWQADALPATEEAAPGTLLRAGKEGLLVACANNSLLIRQLQLAGGKVLSVADLLNARAAQFQPGQRFAVPDEPDR